MKPTIKSALVLWACIGALVYGGVIVVGTGLIPTWGAWRVIHDHHGAQARALLDGRFGLGNSPNRLSASEVWAYDQVQQVWGLGIPILRIPFEWAALRMGLNQFPAQIHFFIFLTLWGCWMLLLHVKLRSPMTLIDVTGGLVAGALVVLFPPFIRSLAFHKHSTMDGVLFWTFLCGMIIQFLLWRFLITGRLKWWLALGAASGFGGFIRPTLLLYGLAALLVATGVVLIQNRSESFNRLRRLSVGWAIFLTFGGLLWATNLIRFGDGFEFGHNLNVRGESGIGTMYATRFNHPFEEAGWVEGMRELAGALFLASSPEQMNQSDFYRESFFPGQSERVRWRNFYFPVYDWSYLLLLLAGCALATVEFSRFYKGYSRGGVRIPGELLGRIGLWTWAFLSFLVLACFYWRVPVLASRYLLDFAPAICGTLWLLWTGLWWRSKSWVSRSVLLTGVGGWMLFQFWNGFPEIAERRSVTAAAIPEIQRESSWSIPVARYERNEDFKQTGIRYNGTGVGEDGSLAPMFLCFVRDTQFLELILEETGEGDGFTNPNHIRAKIGLETLTQTSIERVERGWRIRFAGPRAPRHQNGVQVVFIATVPPESLAEKRTSWKLRRLQWRDH